MEIIVDKRAQKFVGNQSPSDQARILRYLDLFRQYGFKLTVKYLKKIDQAIWELRPSDIRVFFGKSKKDNLIVVLHCYKKQTQKTPQKEIETAKSRLKEYL